MVTGDPKAVSTLRRSDLPLVRGELPEEALAFISEAARLFPGCEKDIIVVRKPSSLSPRGSEIGNETSREGKDNGPKTAA